MTLDITIAVPTFNGASRLPKLLECLKNQKGVETLKWELIIIDNNSTDNLKEVIDNQITTWPAEVPLRYCLEKRQGAAFARQKAIEIAAGSLVGFLDDDNLPKTDWVLQAVTFAQQFPQAAAFSGPIHGVYETPPPEGFEKIQAFLAIREYGDEVYQFNPQNLQLPPAASLVVRRDAWKAHVPLQPTLTGKIPGRFVQGDDYEPLLYLSKAGWEIWYNPNLHSYHQIPAWRFEKSYLMTLAKGCGLATFYLRRIGVSPLAETVLFLRMVLGNTVKIGLCMARYQDDQMPKWIKDFELNFFIGCLLSPFDFVSYKLLKLLNRK